MRKTTKRYLSVILSFVMLITAFGIPVSSHASDSPAVNISASVNTARPSETFTVSVAAGESLSVAALDSTVQYDADQFELVAFDEDLTAEVLLRNGLAEEGFQDGQYRIVWYRASNASATGLYNLTFRVKDTAFNGTYSFTLGINEMVYFVGEGLETAEYTPIIGSPATVTVTGGQDKPSVADASVTLTGTDGLTYGGTVQTPSSVTVTRDGSTLTQDTDYTVSYENAAGETVAEPTDAGTYTVVITGIGDYAGTNRSQTFTIAPKELTLTGASITSKAYDGSTDADVSGGTLDGIIEADRGSVSVEDEGITASFADAYAGSGKAVTVSEVELTGSRAANYIVDPAKITGLTGTITAAQQTLTVTDGSVRYGGSLDLSTLAQSNVSGAEITYDITGGNENGYAALDPEDGSTLRIEDDTAAAGSSITVSAQADAVDLNDDGTPEYEASASQTLTVTITAKQEAVITVTDPRATYDGMAKEATVTVTTPQNYDRDNLTVTCRTEAGETVESPVNAGTYTVTAVYEDDEYYGTASGTLTIQPAALTESLFTVDTSEESYTGSAVTKDVTPAAGSNLTENTDYTVTYENNTNAGTATIRIEGTGNYTGTLEYTFTITAKGLTKEDLAVGAEGTVEEDGTIRLTYSGEALSVPVNAADSEVSFEESTDYRVAYRDSDGQTVSAPENAGSYTLIVTGTGNYSGTLEYPVIVEPKELTLTGVSVVTKPYDGTTEAELELTEYSLKGIIGEDEVALESVTAVFADAGAGSGKSVTIGEAVLSGSDAGNYTVVLPEGLTGTIEQCTTPELTLSNLSQREGSVTKPDYTLTPADPEAAVTFYYASETVTQGETLTLSEEELAAEGLTAEEQATLAEEGVLVKTVIQEGTDDAGNPVTTTETITYTRTVSTGSEPEDPEDPEDGSGSETEDPESGSDTGEGEEPGGETGEEPDIGTDTGEEPGAVTGTGTEEEDSGSGTETVTYTKQVTTSTSSWTEWTEENGPSQAGTYDILAVSSETANVTSAEATGVLTIRERSSGSGSGGSGTSSVTRAITIGSGEGGTLTASPARAAAGTVVTLTATPDSGYAVGTIAVTDAEGNDITLSAGTENSDGSRTYTFTMPASAVTVTVTWQAGGETPDPDNPGTSGGTSCDGGADCPSHGYSDVDTSRWYHEAVDYVVENGLMTGTSDTTFVPEGTLTRAMAVQLLYNYAGTPGTASAAGFDDVASSAWYAEAVAWASANGVVTGYSDSLFGPEDPVTREQLMVILYRYSGSPQSESVSTLSRFSDRSDVSAYAQEAVQWAVAEGLVEGRTSTQLAPKENITRAETAALLMRWIAYIGGED